VSGESSGGSQGVSGLVAQVVLVALAGVLGIVGWSTYEGPGEAVDGWDVGYQTLALYAGNFPDVDSDALPATLQIARFLAPLSALLLVVSATAAVLLGDRWERWRIRRAMRQRRTAGVIVCGRGKLAADTAIRTANDSGRTARGPVVLVSPEAARGSVEFRRAGAHWIHADPRSVETLSSLGADHANAILALDDHKGWNAEVVLAAERVGSRSEAVETHIVGRLGNDVWVPAARDRSSSMRATRHTLTDLDEVAARAILRSSGIFSERQARGRRALVVASDEDAGESLVVEMARAWRAEHGGIEASSDELRIVLVGADAEARRELLLEREPGLVAILDELVAVDLPALDLGRTNRWWKKVGEGFQTDVLLLSPQPLAALSTAREVAPLLGEGESVFVATDWDDRWRSEPLPGENVTVIDLHDELSRIDTYLEGGYAERLARATQDRWAGAGARPPVGAEADRRHLVAWESLEPAQRALWVALAEAALAALTAQGGFRDAMLADLDPPGPAALRAALRSSWQKVRATVESEVASELPEDLGPERVAQGCEDAAIALSEQSWHAKAAAAEHLPENAAVESVAAAVLTDGCPGAERMRAQLDGGSAAAGEALEILARSPSGEPHGELVHLPEDARLLYLAGGAASIPDDDGDRLLGLLAGATEPIHENGIDCAPTAILSGGTNVGVPRVAARLGERLGVPVHGWLPAGAEPAPGVAAHRTQNGDFSIAEPLLMWRELLDAGFDPPRRFRLALIATNGGDITEAEIAFAAAVGVPIAYLPLSGGGRPALLDPEKLQIVVPEDAMSLRAFLLQAWGLLEGSAERDAERLARNIHERYVARQKGIRGATDPAMRPWDELDVVLKRSNIAQALARTRYLQEIGLGVDASREEVEAALTAEAGRAREALAALEHGRWNVERLQQGYRRGPRSPSRRTHPDIVPWEALTEEIAAYDRDAIDGIPKLMGTGPGENA
jgi:hypothetical protein